MPGPVVNDEWEKFMVDRVHQCSPEEETTVKSEFRTIHGAEFPVTVSRTGHRWDGYLLNPTALGELEVECSVSGKNGSSDITFDPKSSRAYLDYQAAFAEMANHVYKYPELHTVYMGYAAKALKAGYSKMNKWKKEAKKGVVAVDDSKAEFVSSNQSGLNHLAKVKRHGKY